MSSQGYGNIQTRAFLKGLIKLHNFKGDKPSPACWAQAARLGAPEQIRSVRQKEAHRFRAAGHPTAGRALWRGGGFLASQDGHRCHTKCIIQANKRQQQLQLRQFIPSVITTSLAGLWFLKLLLWPRTFPLSL